MKKLALLLAILLIASPAFAACTISITDNASNNETINVATAKCDEFLDALHYRGFGEDGVDTDANTIKTMISMVAKGYYDSYYSDQAANTAKQTAKKF